MANSGLSSGGYVGTLCGRIAVGMSITGRGPTRPKLHVCYALEIGVNTRPDASHVLRETGVHCFESSPSGATLNQKLKHALGARSSKGNGAPTGCWKQKSTLHWPAGVLNSWFAGTCVPSSDSPSGQVHVATSIFPLTFPARSQAKLKQLAN